MAAIENLFAQTRVALVINEMQVGIPKLFEPIGRELERRGTVANIARLAETFRAKELPVFHTPAMNDPEYADALRNSMITSLVVKTRAMRAGTDQVAYLPGLEPKPGDLVSARTSGLFALVSTDLNVRLRRMGVGTLVVTGISTNVGIPGFAFTAVDLGYHVIIPEDCIAGSDPEVQDVIVREQLRMVASISSTEELVSILDRSGTGPR